MKPCLSLSQKLKIVVEQAQDADVPGCDDGAVDASHVYEQREVLKSTFWEARMVLWKC